MALYEALVYWLPRPEWSTAPQNSGYAATVFSTVFFVLPGFITIPEFRDILVGNTPVKAGKAGYFY